MEPIAVMTKLTKKGWSNCTFLCAAGSTKCYTFCQLLPEIKGTRKLFQKEYFAFISLLVMCFRTTIVNFVYVLFLFVCVLFHFKGLHHKVKKQRSCVSTAIFKNFGHERFPAVASQ